MLKNILLFFIGLSLCVMTSIHAAQVSGDTLTRVNIEQVNKIAGKLIAPCCWKQTVDVHPSSASDKIKAEIKKALLEGQTEEQIINRFVAEYGERIRAIPKPEGINLFLWILPALVLLIGGLMITLYLRYVSKQKKYSDTVLISPIPDSDIERVERELKELDA